MHGGYDDDDLLALSGLQHIAYCERQWALIHVEQIWADSGETMRGKLFHSRVDTKGYSCERGIRAERSVRVVSHKLGLYGIADIVEYDMKSGLPLMPIEYKVGKPKIEDWDRLQVTAQALCLEEMEGIRIAAGALFYGETRRRDTVPITEKLRRRVEDLAVRMHDLFRRGVTPVVTASTKCRRCSLVNDCVPHALQDARSYWNEHEVVLEAGHEATA